MAFTCKVLFFTILLVLTNTNARLLESSKPLSSSSLSLAARLKVDDDSSETNCWDTLFHLQACSGELILFFLNGETYLGRGCCQAIHTIGNKCWPNMIDTLGFTSEEGDILEGYCDHQAHDDEDGDGHSKPVLH
ncbi:hypothetical protein ACFE04_031878 [Oxalis oulophora]